MKCSQHENKLLDLLEDSVANGKCAWARKHFFSNLAVRKYYSFYRVEVK